MLESEWTHVDPCRRCCQSESLVIFVFYRSSSWLCEQIPSTAVFNSSSIINGVKSDLWTFQILEAQIGVYLDAQKVPRRVRKFVEKSYAIWHLSDRSRRSGPEPVQRQSHHRLLQRCSGEAWPLPFHCPHPEMSQVCSWEPRLHLGPDPKEICTDRGGSHYCWPFRPRHR